MKNIILILILFCSLNAEAFMGAHVAGSAKAVSGGGEPCDSGTYDFSDGDNESFENAFCTAGWSETDPDSVVSFSTSYSNCGYYGIKITADLDTAGSNYIEADIGAQDGSFYERFYMQCPTYLTAYKLLVVRRYAEVSGGGSGDLMDIRLYAEDSNTAFSLRLRVCGESPSEKITNITSDDILRVELYKDGGTVKLKAWKKNGASWDALATSNGAPDYTVESVDGACSTPRYFITSDDTSDTTAFDFYVDDFKVDLSGSGYIGGQTCE